MARRTRRLDKSIQITQSSERAKDSKSPKASSYIANTAPAVRSQMSGATTLTAFRESVGRLSKADRLRIIEQALVLLEQNYAHLPLKKALHAVDPIQRLRLLEFRTRNESDVNPADEWLFHREMSTIFHSVRDLHTNYILPEPYKRMTAFVPFMIESFYQDENGEDRRYLVSHILQGFEAPPLEPGVEALRWNGIPIDRAVELNGDRFAGSNLEARKARGIKTLTVRPLLLALPPDEDFVLLEYRAIDGTIQELRVDWLIFSPEAEVAAAVEEMESAVATAQGIDLELDMVNRARKVLFAPQVVEAERKLTARGKAAATGRGLQSQMPSILEASIVDTTSGTFGYIRIRSFSVDSADRFVKEFIRLAEQLPQNGLIIDVRGNGGGLILAGEQLLQVLTPRRIEPERFQFLNTSLNLALATLNDFLAAWVDSMNQSLLTGAMHSSGFFITPEDAANATGQRYYGPIVLVTDALCYSTTDMFAAGFQDHGIGPILGTDGNTGAGGANVWTHGLLRRFHQGSPGGTPYRELPSGSDMRVSIRRSVRVGPNSGTLLEDFGVVPDEVHLMTRDDLMNGNVDLVNRAASILATLPIRRISVEIVSSSDTEVKVRVSTLSLDRLDVMINGRPQGSLDIDDGETELTIPVDEPIASLEFKGFDRGELVTFRRIHL